MSIKFVRSISESTRKKGAVRLVADSTPASLSITGADVQGLADDFVIAAGSQLITPDNYYIALTDGEFTQCSYPERISTI